ncbi:YkoF family thiamine/hydroxymethylpyrimidine-binding protein [Halomonas sp. CUBES01]|uniref:YkoF family thiamine/hydroxymethylpyrimidine-binding protein n=1 Tax=Vreelandella gomseomensis TaxID=370766 RepID=A0ABU1GFV5_9GAMM|nr:MULTISPECIES: YkoF family thiamine/hydroxymethylpyrimidine-binding protein [Halomonas]MDR5876370.1 YkoF family thiamine/hydroxymethylpyrimidine-binding protein [Halomonas gomseomensis]MEC4766375.1 YkoF family thiamine/hydroxymethylpyrimidine-binding protein [Halomonas sp. CUBES01]
MYLSVQLSYYPLADDFKPAVKEVVKRLEASGLEVHPNRMSTQVFGEFDAVMAALGEVMKWSFETHGKAVFTVNFLEGDRRPR